MWIDDQVMVRADNDLTIEVFAPQSTFVVLGSSNRAEVECHEDACERDGIPILKRKGGGGTVLLYPGCAVCSIGTWVEDRYDNNRYFKLLNQAVIDALAKAWPEFRDLGQNGISDITWKDRKICGTSLFRSRNYLLYQASIIVELDPEAIETYLAHPSKEPEYRKGKSHRDFLASAGQILPGVEIESLILALRENLPQSLAAQMEGDRISAVPSQVAHVLKRSKTNPSGTMGRADSGRLG